ncbi:TIGR03067 domain-containing protein [Singulisphaera sp. GP187]|uniref:TIGR03067 domain-containing protein n=1 Tax=Singulisphaera sp. GP187 TaxID=1882752 RepID=UPI0013562A24|nr:TIGR03067 domain-containing protein [Singulisphaera sp. GP187]
MGLILVVILDLSAWFPRGDAASIQGRWRVVRIEDSGVAVNEPFLMTRQYIFDARKLIVSARGKPIAASLVGEWIERNIKSPSFKLDPTSTPKAIDLVLPTGTTLRGIYDLDGDRLKLCFTGPSGKAAMARPTGFSVPGSGARLVVIERECK